VAVKAFGVAVRAALALQETMQFGAWVTNDLTPGAVSFDPPWASGARFGLKIGQVHGHGQSGSAIARPASDASKRRRELFSSALPSEPAFVRLATRVIA